MRLAENALLRDAGDAFKWNCGSPDETRLSVCIRTNFPEPDIAGVGERALEDVALCRVRAPLVAIGSVQSLYTVRG